MAQRIAVIVLETLSAGEAANVAALLTGQIGCCKPGFFCPFPVQDADGAAHASPIFSVVILKAKNASQLTKLVTIGGANTVCFTKLGQALHNDFPEYKQKVAELHASADNLIGVAIFGGDAMVRDASRKFSLLK
jgi:hypothetical protein